MESFTLSGKIIDEKNKPKKRLKISAYDSDPVIDSDDFLGSATTASDGSFHIEFDNSKFQNFWELLEGTPDVYLKIDQTGKKNILQTRTKQTKKELEYHIKLGKQTGNPDIVDIYGDNVAKIMSMLNDVGLNIGRENSINLDTLTNGRLPDVIRKRIEEFVAGSEQRVATFNNMMAMLSGLVNSFLEEQNLETINYDGPQVPRLPWRQDYNQVIVWPRDE